MTYRLPAALSTVNVGSNDTPPIMPELEDSLASSIEIDRSQINAWEEREVRSAVEAKGPNQGHHDGAVNRGLPRLPQPRPPAAGYEVFPVVDGVGGTSPEAHRAGLERINQAGSQPITWVSLTASSNETGRAPRRCRTEWT